MIVYPDLSYFNYFYDLFLPDFQIFTDASRSKPLCVAYIDGLMYWVLPNPNRIWRTNSGFPVSDFLYNSVATRTTTISRRTSTSTYPNTVVTRRTTDSRRTSGKPPLARWVIPVPISEIPHPYLPPRIVLSLPWGCRALRFSRPP